MNAAPATRRLAVLFDPLDEGWTSMDYVGELLVAELRAHFGDRLEAFDVRPNIPRLFRRLHAGAWPSERARFNADRLVARHALYPLQALRERSRADCFHVVDHSYAQLVHSLPAEKTGVYCHDLDAFLCLVEPSQHPRPAWFRALARRTLAGMQKAAVVFHSTQVVREALVRYRLVAESKLVHAPYGIAPDFSVSEGTVAAVHEPETRALAQRLNGRPYLLHVGNAAPRKRLDVLFQLFAGVRRTFPELLLVQQGAALSDEQHAWVQRLGLGDALVQPGPLSRAALAWLYRNASAVLLPSEKEGFGLPMIEALACGAPVVASDLPVLREVSGAAAGGESSPLRSVRFCTVGEVERWVEVTTEVLRAARGSGAEAERTERLERASEIARRYRWTEHARRICEAYERL